jgi:hypothetical protein
MKPVVRTGATEPADDLPRPKLAASDIQIVGLGASTPVGVTPGRALRQFVRASAAAGTMIDTAVSRCGCGCPGSTLLSQDSSAWRRSCFGD